MSHSLTFPTKSLSVGSLESYIHWVNQIPLLTLEEEQDLAHRFKSSQDLDAARKLILSHLRLVVRIARGYAGYGLSEADLIQEGNIGLMKAVKRFDPKVGVRLVSFAIHWIRAEIHEFILKNWRIVKIATTKAQRKLFFNIRKAAKKSQWFSNSETAAVAEQLNVSESEVRLMEMRLHSQDEEIDVKDAPTLYLEDQSYNPARLLEQNDWSSQRENSLYQALENLDERSQAILKHRWLNEKKLTLQELAAMYQITAERVRQLEATAFKKLRKQIGTVDSF